MCQKQQLKEHFLSNYLSVSPVKLVQYWPHASWVVIDNIGKNICQSVVKQGGERKKDGYCKAFSVTHKRKNMEF